MMNVPRLRFKEFCGDWDVKALGEISSIKRGASPRPIADKKWFSEDSKVGWVRISDVSRSDKFLNCTQQYLSNEGISKSRLVNKGNIIMSICATIGKPIYTNFDVCIHDGFVVFDELQINNEFLYYYLMLIEKNWYQYGQPGSQVNLNSDIVSNEIITIPIPKEQTKIANFLTAIDLKITNLTQKVELLTRYKKGVMQQIFSQQLRFKDDDGLEFAEWEDKELRDVFQITRGNVLAMTRVSNVQTKESPYPVFSSQTKNNGLSGFYNDYLYEDCITWTTDGANAGDVNYRSGKFYCTNVCGVLKNNNGFANACIAAMINTVSKNYVSYVGNPKLMNNVMAKIKIKFPCLNEQTKIANFLTALDDKLTNTRTKLDTMKQYKQGLLQQLFV